MSVLRINVDLAIPEKVANQRGVKEKLQDLRELIRQAKTYSIKINEGQLNEEMTVRGTYHICHHDEPGNDTPCVEIEI